MIIVQKVTAQKKTWKGDFIIVNLRITEISLNILDVDTDAILSKFFFKDIVEILKVDFKKHFTIYIYVI